MVCSKCGQELKEGAKFCTKCGANFKVLEKPSQLIFLSIILSGFGIIGYWIMRFLIYSSAKAENYSSIDTYWIFATCFTIITCAAIIVALFSLKNQKSFLGIIAGIIPCANIIVAEGYYIIRNIIETLAKLD